MRRALRARVRPLVERFQAKLLELATARLDAEVDRIEQADAFADALVAFDPELFFGKPPRGFRKAARKGQTSDTPARKAAAESKSAVEASPVPEADDSSCGAPHASGNGGLVRGGATRKPSDRRRRHHDWGSLLGISALPAVPEPAVAAEQGSTSTVVDDLAKRIPAFKDIEARAAAQLARGETNHVTCSKCGHVGGNARGCGKPTGHPTLGATVSFTPVATTPYETAKAKVDRTYAVVTVPPPTVHAPSSPPPPSKVDRLATLRARNAERPAGDKPVARAEPEDDNPTASEHWTEDEISVARGLAESHKRTGELPEPKSSWGF